MDNKESATNIIPLTREEREELRLRISIAIGLSKQLYYTQT